MTEHEEAQTLIAIHQVGQMVDMFMKSDLGRYLVGKAEQEEFSLLREIQSTPAHDQDRIAHLQMESKARRLFVEWLGAAVDEGIHAKNEFDYRFINLEGKYNEE